MGLRHRAVGGRRESPCRRRVRRRTLFDDFHEARGCRLVSGNFATACAPPAESEQLVGAPLPSLGRSRRTLFAVRLRRAPRSRHGVNHSTWGTGGNVATQVNSCAISIPITGPATEVTQTWARRPSSHLLSMP